MEDTATAQAPTANADATIASTRATTGNSQVPETVLTPFQTAFKHYKRKGMSFHDDPTVIDFHRHLQSASPAQPTSG